MKAEDVRKFLKIDEPIQISKGEFDLRGEPIKGFPREFYTMDSEEYEEAENTREDLISISCALGLETGRAYMFCPYFVKRKMKTSGKN